MTSIINRTRVLTTAIIVKVILSLGLIAGSASAVTVPFTETFSTGVANWLGPGPTSNPSQLIHHPTGGVDGGGYVSTDPNFQLEASSFTGSFGAIVFRGNSINPVVSGGAFQGNWLAAGVNVVRAYVRHNSTESPLDYYIRLTTHPNNFGAMVFFASNPVPASTDWSLVEFDISPTNATPAGGSFAGTLSNVGHLQIGATLVNPDAVTDLNNTYFLFDLDQVSIAVPEPSSLLLAVGALACVVVGRRSRSC